MVEAHDSVLEDAATPSTDADDSADAASPEDTTSPGDGPLHFQVVVLLPAEEQIVSTSIRTLNEAEQLWASRHGFLERSGYRLRPRYRPGWEPSWKEGQSTLRHEDRIRLDMPSLLDATRIKDGQPVMLKYVSKNTREIEIGTYLWSDELRGDPRNHTIPLLEVLYDPDDVHGAILVMPLLRCIDSPRPASVGECVDFVSQTLEGLAFMHEHKVAHRDCAWGNLMMDGRGIHPRGWHPQSPDFYPDGVTSMPNELPTRTAVGGVRYYFIDFGISSRDQDLVTGDHCQEPVPELSAEVPYNPYKLDIFILGMAFQHSLVEVHGRLDFLKPFIAYMTSVRPEERPTAVQAVARFAEIRSTLSKTKLAQRLAPRKPEAAWTRRWKDVEFRASQWWASLRVLPRKKLPPFA